MQDFTFNIRHWRHSEMGVRFLSLMVRHDHPFPVSGVKLVVTSLTHDLVAVRKVSTTIFI